MKSWWKRRNRNIKSMNRENNTKNTKNLRENLKVRYLLFLAQKMIMDLINQHR
jgi:hypothetical protein